MKKYTGVYKTTKKDNTCYYRASITYRHKHISLGSFSTAEEANAAYLEAGKILENPDIMPDSYIPQMLSFSKCVSLMNFRDHNLYIKTPIYIKNKFFFYYYSQDIIYTFDIDDLFYYAHHTIMKRGHHLFVADYGMQVNILNRYGIHNFAVENKDYYFSNGDHHDFRYSNIICLNPYFGVTQVKKCGSCQYLAKIHINGDYRIGVYPSVIEAAIAYNKAVDIVKKQGINKNYTLNYIDGLSPSEYASIYSDCKISEKLYQLTSSHNQ
jgi:hypothetical protein